ncbi:hypothetical protein [Tenacibaculum sp. 190524A05c]|uniref:hypothetical protein n=1 Tax=Tenacibaculum platacis TaxID=3137852 RepID=UPI0032B2E823
MISIREGIIEYTGTSKEIGLYLYCKPFKLSISEIRYIILSPRLVIDDEEAYLLFIDKEYQKYVLPLFHTSNIDLIENLCGTRLTGDLYFDKFSYEDHYGKVDCIVYPKNLQWKPAYKNDWKLIVRVLYTWILPKSFFGTLIEY